MQSKGVHIHVRCDALPEYFCTALERTLKERGLRGLFIRNLLEAVCGEDEQETIKNIMAVITKNFSIGFGQAKQGQQSAALPEQSEVKQDAEGVFKKIKEELDEFAEEFVKTDE